MTSVGIITFDHDYDFNGTAALTLKLPQITGYIRKLDN